MSILLISIPINCWCVNRCDASERESEKKTNILPTADNTGGSACIVPSSTPSSPLCSRWVWWWGCGEQQWGGRIFFFFFLNSSNTRDKPAELLIHYQMCEETRLVHFTSWGKHVWAVPVGKLRGRGEGRMYEVRLMPQRAEEGETLKDIQWNSRSCSDINLLNCSLNFNNTIMHFFFFFNIL